MAGEGPSLGELMSGGGFIFKLIKAIFIFALLYGVIASEVEMVSFAFKNLTTTESEFKKNEVAYNLMKQANVKKEKPKSYLDNVKFGYLIGEIKGKELNEFKTFRRGEKNTLLSIAIILTIPCIVFISYYHTRSKRFPNVVIGTFINNAIIYISLFLLVIGGLFLFGVYGFGLFAAPLFYTIYLLRFKGKKRNNKTTKFDVIKTKEKEEGFIFKTNSGDIHLKNPYRGIFIQGGAGSGKSASVFEPIIQQAGEKNFTGILYDFKSPELTDKLKISYENSSVSVRNIDFKHPFLSDRVNPIDPKYLVKSAVAIEYAQVLINNLMPESIKKPDYWTNNAKMILAGVIWYLRNEEPEKCTLPHAISLILHNPIDELIAKISQDFEAGGMVASLRESIERGSEKTVAGMLSTLQNGLSLLNSQDVFWILSGNDTDLHLNNPENPSFLCLGNDSTLPNVYSPVISLIIAVSLRQMNRPNQEKSVVLLDEAPTIFIPNIEQIPATARSNKIATVFGVQDYAQLAERYGQEKAQVIISNLGNQFFGRVTNGKTAEMVQGLFSKSDKVFVSKSEGSGTSGKFIHLGSNMSDGTSESIQERDRVKVNDLINLSSGQFYGIIAEGTPREFLATQFKREEIKESYINQKTPINKEIMRDNYFRIINECKEVFA